MEEIGDKCKVVSAGLPLEPAGKQGGEEGSRGCTSSLMYAGGHKVCIYKEYHSVCPLVGIGTLPTPLSPASVPSPQNWGGGHT
jgi:hypothetical protein